MSGSGSNLILSDEISIVTDTINISLAAVLSLILGIILSGFYLYINQNDQLGIKILVVAFFLIIGSLAFVYFFENRLNSIKFSNNQFKIKRRRKELNTNIGDIKDISIKHYVKHTGAIDLVNAITEAVANYKEKRGNVEFCIQPKEGKKIKVNLANVKILEIEKFIKEVENVSKKSFKRDEHNNFFSPHTEFYLSL